MNKLRNKMLLLSAVLFAVVLSAAYAPATARQPDDLIPPVPPNINWFTGATAGTKKFFINNAYELAGLAQIVNGTAKDDEGEDILYSFAGDTVVLVNDINLWVYSVGEGWVPIGMRNDKPFSGVFDGGEKIISSLTINRPDANDQGVFGFIVNGVIKNLGVENVNIIGKENVGGIVGRFQGGSMTNCYSTGTVSSTDGVIGGLIGGMLGDSISNCYSTAAVTGTGVVGGLVGNVVGTHIKNSYSIGAVNATDHGWHTGGVVATNGSTITVTDCAALNIEVKSAHEDAGRVVGWKSQGRLERNVGFDGMKNIDGNTAWANIGADNLDGANITIAQILADGTIGGRFTDAGGWTTENGKLPGLFGRTVAMPEHLGGTASVKQITRNQASSAQFVNVTGRTLNLNMAGRGKVDIYALNGAKLRTFDLDKGSHTLRLTNLPRGAYVVSASSGAWKRSARVVVK